jgi:hypothetical protein
MTYSSAAVSEAAAPDPVKITEPNATPDLVEVHVRAGTSNLSLADAAAGGLVMK